MTAPRRLLEDPASLRDLMGGGTMTGDDELGKVLLESALGDPGAAGPSAALKAQMWSSIEAALPLVGAAAAAAAASSGAASAAGGAAGGTAASSAAVAGSTAATGAAAASTAAAAGAGASAVGATAAAPVLGLSFVTKVGIASIFVGGSFATAGVVRQQMNAAETPPAIVATADPAPFSSGEGSQRLPALYDTIGNGGSGSGAANVVDPPSAEDEPAAADKRADEASERARTSKKDDKPRTSSDKHADASSSASKLVEEAAGVQQARQSLAQGNPSRALSILSQLDKDIPGGGLGQERAILTIEALAASGQKSQAAQLANAFIAANPSSPYADRARRHAQ